MLKLGRDLIAFIRANLPSVWALELLLLLRDAPERSWPRAELVAELRASDAVVTSALGSLQQSGLVVETPDSEYRYAPAGPAAAALCDEVARAYRERPVAVMAAISAPAGRVRD